MRFLDSGVVIAAFASWHESHPAARREVAAGAQVVGHTLLETLSVLTRLPAPHRATVEVVAEYLRRTFSDDVALLDAHQLHQLATQRLPALGISGGAIYDAAIAETVRLAGGTLVTLDRRALSTYQRIGCPAELLT